MIEIITASGVSLDMDPTYEFEIEMENPMLDDTHIPIAYSTSIAFLPTTKNKEVFGYLSAMRREPEIKQLSISIHVGGIPLFWGRLEYENIEDGKLNYTFAGRNLEDEWGTYIHKLTHLSKYEISKGGQYLQQFENTLKQIRDGGFSSDFEIPMIVGEEKIADVEYMSNDINAENSPYIVKYHNYYWNPLSATVTPAVKISSILSEAFRNVSISDTISDMYNSLAILGLHRTKQLCAQYGLQQAENSSLLLDVADMLPNCTVLDLIINVTRLFCATIFRDGDSYVLKTNKEVLQDPTIIDWTDRVSDIYSLSSENGASYSFGYSNDDSENTYTAERESVNSEGGTIIDVKTMLEVLSVVKKSTAFVAVRNTITGDMYSGKKMTITTTAKKQYTLPYMDMLLHKLHKVNSDETKEHTFDNTVNFKCVRCIPINSVDEANEKSALLYQMCPIVKFPAAEDNRNSDVWIGTLFNNQLVDKGVYFARLQSGDEENSTEYRNSNKTLDPDVLFRRYHRNFAEWLAEDRTVVKTDAYLSLPEIAELRLYNKVFIYGQVFLIKKITYTLTPTCDSILTQVELIEAPRTISGNDKINNVINVEYSGDLENQSFKAVSQIKVASEVTVSVEIYDFDSTTLTSTVTLTIPVGKTESTVRYGVAMNISNITPSEDSSQVYAIGSLIRV